MKCLQKRNFHFVLILLVVVVSNFGFSSFVFWFLRSNKTRFDSVVCAFRSDIDTCRLYCSSVVEYVQLYDSLRPSQSVVKEDVNKIDESDDDVVGVYGYGQTRSTKHIWLYRDDMLRDGRSRRVYLKRIPLGILTNDNSRSG